nr:hypothetical protein [Sicyoidochytrium minutum DNA virus]
MFMPVCRTKTKVKAMETATVNTSVTVLLDPKPGTMFTRTLLRARRLRDKRMTVRLIR